MKTKLILPKLHIELERWKYNEGLDVYVSSFGNFKNKNGMNLHTGVCNGYLRFKGKPVHRIVLSMFAPVPGWESLTVDHLDHNTRNNRVSNLEWVTADENQTRAAIDEKEHCIDSTTNDTKKVMMVKLNNVIIPLETAKTIMMNDKTMQQCKERIEKTFESILKNNFENVPEVYVGGYKLTKA